uniref:Uncharacterized protein n=1 Tax=Cannabis sativa TaxID=3483 RepID=A0A803QR03_CANSA
MRQSRRRYEEPSSVSRDRGVIPQEKADEDPAMNTSHTANGQSAQSTVTSYAFVGPVMAADLITVIHRGGVMHDGSNQINDAIPRSTKQINC